MGVVRPVDADERPRRCDFPDLMGNINFDGDHVVVTAKVFVMDEKLCFADIVGETERNLPTMSANFVDFGSPPMI